jgi:hypothetical protein
MKNINKCPNLVLPYCMSVHITLALGDFGGFFMLVKNILFILSKLINNIKILQL